MFLLLALFCLKVGSPSTIQGSLNLAATLLSYSSVPGLWKCRQLWPAFSSRGQSYKFSQGWQQRILFSYWKEIPSCLDLFARLVTRHKLELSEKREPQWRKCLHQDWPVGKPLRVFLFFHLCIYLYTYLFTYLPVCLQVRVSLRSTDYCGTHSVGRVGLKSQRSACPTPEYCD